MFSALNSPTVLKPGSTGTLEWHVTGIHDCCIKFYVSVLCVSTYNPKHTEKHQKTKIKKNISHENPSSVLFRSHLIRIFSIFVPCKAVAGNPSSPCGPHMSLTFIMSERRCKTNTVASFKGWKTKQNKNTGGDKKWQK